MGTSLRIAIDASRTTVARVTGTEHYSLELTRHIIQHNDNRYDPHQLHLFFRDEPAANLLPPSPHVTHHVIPMSRLWTHLAFARAIARLQPDVTFVPAHTLPLLFPGKAVVTVHDLGYKYFPEAHPLGQRLYLDWATRHSARRATLILADSDATAADLYTFYGTNRQKIRIVYPGVQNPTRGDRLGIYNKYNIPSRYFLFVGTLQPRKNIRRIVEAYQMWQHANNDQEIGLVLAGNPGWLFDPAWIAGVENVHLTGYFDEADKGTLIRNASVLLFPTLHEGFGFPVIEAMHCGTPVIASATSSLPELVGDAGILVDPLQTKEIASALDLLMNNAQLRSRLMVKGFQQAQKFTWSQAAEQALNALEEAASR